MAKLARSVHVTDPKSGRRLVLTPGEEPASHLAALVTNPAAWVDGKLPGPPKAKAETEGDSGPAGSASEASGAADTTPAEDTASEDTKPAAKRAARKPARGRSAAAEGTGGQ